MLALEHTLITLLLLVGLINARPRLHPAAWVAVAGGLGLAFIAPAWPLPLAWDVLAAAAIPLLLWQAARQLAGSVWPARAREAILYLVTAAAIAGVLGLPSALPPAGAVLFGLLAASMVWRGGDESGRPGALGLIGPLALAFLLTEIAPAVEAPGRYLLGLLGGAGVGCLAAYGSAQVALRLRPGRAREGVNLGQAYLAYLAATLLDLSGVAAATLSVAVYLAYGTRRNLWPAGDVQPRPLDARPVFAAAALALGFFAWQTHVALSVPLVAETLLSMAIAWAAVALGRRLLTPALRGERSAASQVARATALVAAGLLLWPREVLLEPAPLGFALAAAVLAAALARLALAPVLRLYAWLDEAGVDREAPEALAGGLCVGDLMTRAVVTAGPATLLPDLARLLADHPSGCVPIVDEAGGLLGLVTAGDLFPRQAHIPRSDRRYTALFEQPVSPERLPEAYAALGMDRRAGEVMTARLVWTCEHDPLGLAVRRMVESGHSRLPVVDRPPEEGGRLVGLLTRTDVIRLLTRGRGAGESTTAAPAPPTERPSG